SSLLPPLPPPPPSALYTLSLHDALPIYLVVLRRVARGGRRARVDRLVARAAGRRAHDAAPPIVELRRQRVFERRAHQPSKTRCRSEEHTSELQSPYDIVCRLLLEKKNKK